MLYQGPGAPPYFLHCENMFLTLYVQWHEPFLFFQMKTEEDVPKRAKRLARGFESNNTYWPWYVDLVGCGAAMIHPQIVITAAHCGYEKLSQGRGHGGTIVPA